MYGGIYIDEPLIFDKDYDSDGICTDFNYGGSRGAHRYYYAQQVNFNVTAMVVDDGDGSVTHIEWAEYDPYGAATVTIADGQSATGNPYLFQGRRLDSDTGLYYFRNRMYNAELGRFLQRDPMGYVDGMNSYEWVRSNPLAFLDPLVSYKFICIQNDHKNAGCEYKTPFPPDRLKGVTGRTLLYGVHSKKGWLMPPEVIRMIVGVGLRRRIPHLGVGIDCTA